MLEKELCWITFDTPVSFYLLEVIFIIRNEEKHSSLFNRIKVLLIFAALFAHLATLLFLKQG